MKKWRRIAGSIVVDGGWALCGVAGFLYGVSWAENLFKFFAWIVLLLKIVMLLALATASPEDHDWPERHARAPANASDAVAVVVAAAAGWFITATVIGVQWLVGEMVWHRIASLRDREPDQGEEESE